MAVNMNDLVDLNGVAKIRDWANGKLQDKAAINGYYDDLAAGSAGQLIATVGIEDTAPYSFRTSGGNASIGERETDTIIGGSIFWNQKIRNVELATTDYWGHTRCTLSASGGVLSATFGQYSSSTKIVSARFCVSTSDTLVGVPIKDGHAVLISFDWNETFDENGAVALRYGTYSTISMTTNNSTVFAVADNIESGVWGHFDAVVVAQGDISYLNIGSASSTTSKNIVMGIRNPQVYDLTQMFGETIAAYILSLETATPGAGVAWFRKYFPKARYAYDPGTMRSVNTSEHKMVGFNAYNHATGTAHLLGGERYQITGAFSAVSYLNVDGNTEIVTPDESGYFTPMKDGVLTVTGGNGTTTCVHLVQSGYRDGEWEEYEEHAYELDYSLTLRGIPRLDDDSNLYYDGDTYESDGTVTRNFVYARTNASGGITLWDGTSKDWGADLASGKSYGPYVRFWIANSGSFAVNGYGFCSMYPVGNSVLTATNADKAVEVKLENNTTRVVLRDTSIPNWTSAETTSDLAAAVTQYFADQYALGNVFEIIMKLVEPTTESALVYTNPQVVDDFGTEEYVDYASKQGLRDVVIPVGHTTLYQANLRDKLQHLPEPAESDGTYLIAQTNGEMSLTQYVPVDVQAEIGAQVRRAYGTAVLGGAVGMVETETSFTWSQGIIDGQHGGVYSGNTYNLTSSILWALNNVSRITCDADHKFVVSLGSTTSWCGIVNPTTGVCDKVSVTDDYYTQDLFLGDLADRYKTTNPRYGYRITLARTDGEEITTSDEFTVTTYRATDDTLTLGNYSADANVTGKLIGLVPVDLTSATTFAKRILQDGTVSDLGSSSSAQFYVNNLKPIPSSLYVVAGTRQATVTFLGSSFENAVAGSDISSLLATGETGPHIIAPGSGAYIPIPGRYTYVVITLTDENSRDFTPSLVVGTVGNSVAELACTVVDYAKTPFTVEKLSNVYVISGYSANWQTISDAFAQTGNVLLQWPDGNSKVLSVYESSDAYYVDTVHAGSLVTFIATSTTDSLEYMYV